MDFRFSNHGSICLLKPTSEAGKAWVDEHLTGDEVQTYAGAVVIEPRYAQPILDGIINDGLEVG